MSFPLRELRRPGVPRLRGLSHLYAFIFFLPASIVLWWSTSPGIAGVSAALYAFGICGMFGVSALYHRGPFSDRARRWMRRLDHSMIFVFIAGSYTPFASISLSGTLGDFVLAVVWGGGLLGTLTKLFWIDAPDWFSALVYALVGSSMVIALPELVAGIGLFATALVVAGGICYLVGGVVFAIQRPDPVPNVFGFHEVFHLLVIAGASFHFLVIATFVL